MILGICMGPAGNPRKRSSDTGTAGDSLALSSLCSVTRYWVLPDLIAVTKGAARAATHMFFLIRMAFWFSLVLLFLPIWPTGGDTDQQPVGAIRTFIAAQQAIGDLSRICEREPDVCETGKAAAQTIGMRAREGARIAAEMLEQTQAGSAATTDLDAISTETVPDGVAPTPPTALLPTPRPAN